jgi:hypothetical protein
MPIPATPNEHAYAIAIANQADDGEVIATRHPHRVSNCLLTAPPK